MVRPDLILEKHGSHFPVFNFGVEILPPACKAGPFQTSQVQNVPPFLSTRRGSDFMSVNRMLITCENDRLSVFTTIIKTHAQSHRHSSVFGVVSYSSLRPNGSSDENICFEEVTGDGD